MACCHVLSFLVFLVLSITPLKSAYAKLPKTSILTCPEGYHISTTNDGKQKMILECRDDKIPWDTEPWGTIELNCPEGFIGQLVPLKPKGQRAYLRCIRKKRKNI